MKLLEKKISRMISLTGIFLASGFLLTSAQTVLEEQLEFSLEEGVPPGSLVGRVRLKPDFNYRLNEKSPWFSFNAQNGEIRTIGDLDREALDSDRLDLIIVGTSPAYFIAVRITVTDQNDNSPRFPYPFQNVSIPESVRVGTQIAINSASDPDSGSNGRISRYTIVSGNSQKNFKLLSSKTDDGEPTILLEVQKELDRESESSYSLNISASDAGNPPQSGYLTLFLNILDANDNAPLFSQSHYQVSVRETLPAGSQVAQVTASDSDMGANGDLVYYLGGGGENSSQFEIDSITGIITTNVQQLSCPPRKFCSESEEASDAKSCSPLCIITVEAVDHGVPAQRGRAFVNVELVDENDHDPEILFRMYPEGVEVASVDENVPIGSVVAVVTVSDGDSGLNGKTEVEIESGNELGHFILKSSDPFSLLRVNAPLNLNRVPRYNLSVTARDFGTPSRFSRRFLPIFVRDSSEKPPVFDNLNYTISIPENAEINTYVIAVGVDQDSDSEHSKDIRFEIISGNELGWFRMNEDTGLILTDAYLDFEETSIIELKIRAKESRVGFASATTIVKILIEDSNDQIPVFKFETYSVETPDGLPVGSEIFVFEAKDADTGKAGEISYILEDSKFSSFFVLDSKTGQLRLAKSFKKSETGALFNIQTIAQDNSWPHNAAKATLIIQLTSNIDSPPIFSPNHYYFNVFIGASAGDEVGKISATDSGTRISYALLSNPGNAFRIESQSGELFLTAPAALLNGPTVLTVTAKRSEYPGYGKATVTVFPLPGSKEDLIPVFSPTHFEFSVIEDSTDSGRAEKVIGAVSAVDFDESTRVEYSIQQGNEDSLFEIGRYSGELRKVEPMDREKQDYYSLEVVAVGRKGIAKAPIEIAIKDRNDNTPRFLSDKISGDYAEAFITKELPIGMPIFYATASDPDKAYNGEIDYELLGDDDRIFHIDNHTGLITLKVPTFMVPKNSYSLRVTASDRGSPPKSAELSLSIKVDPNQPLDKSPQHAEYFLSEFITEDTPVNTKLRQLELPMMKLHNVRFKTLSSSTKSAFAVSPDGWLYIQKPLDYEKQQHYTLKVIAEASVEDNKNKDLLSPKQETSIIEINFFVLDSNDEAPKCSENPVELNLMENAPLLTIVGFIEATDLDSGLNGRLHYKLLSQTDKFLIDENSGEIKSLKTFDRELMIRSAATSSISLEIEVSDMGEKPKLTRCKAVVTILDENDLQPVFSLDVYTGSVEEGENAIGKEILQVTATDEDEGANGIIDYILKPSLYSLNFQLDKKSGKLTLAKAVDREHESTYMLEIIGRDNGDPPKSSIAKALVSVKDVNDEKPEILDYPLQSLNLSEWLEVGSVITKITAKDNDAGYNGKISFEIISGNVNQCFEINSVTGEIRLIKELDHETIPAYTLTVSAKDHGNPALSSSVPVVINVMDENDNSPEIRGGPSVLGQVIENAPVGTKVLTVAASDEDSGANGKTRFHIKWQKPESAFEIDENSGVLSTTKQLDRESIDSYSLRIAVSDTPLNPMQTLTAERTVAVLVTDSNDFAPDFVGPTASTIEEGSPANYPITTLSVQDLDNGLNASVGLFPLDDGSVAFRESSQLFGLNANGDLFLKTPLYSATRSIYRMSVQAVDRLDPTTLVGIDPSSGSGLENRLSTRTEISVIVTSSNSRDIVFNSDSNNLAGSQIDYVFDVPEDATVGMKLGKVSATGKSRGTGSSRIEYYVTETRQGDYSNVLKTLPISVDRTTGSLKINSKLDRESMGPSLIMDVYAVNVIAKGPQAAKCQIRFDLIDPELAPFSLDPDSGELRIRAALDRETTREYRLPIQVSDGELTSESELEIDVSDWNDNAPQFITRDISEKSASNSDKPSYTFSVAENSPRNTFVGKIEASDQDFGMNGKVEYFLESPEDAQTVLSLDQVTGVLTVSGHLDHESRSIFILKVRAEDKGNPSLSSLAVVFVNVLDANDHQPTFIENQQRISVPENLPIGSVITKLEIEDADLEPIVLFMISAGDPWGKFGIRQDGSVFLRKPLDREQSATHNLVIRASDGEYGSQLNPGELSGASTCQLFVSVTDVNDNSPIFMSNDMAVVEENSPIGTVVTILSAKDLDLGLNASIEFHMDPSTAGTFSVDPVLGWVRVNKNLDREIQDQYNLTIWAEDRGNPVLRSRQNLTVTILDQNDNQPRFINTSVQLSVSEDTSVGTSLLQLTVEDKDIGANAAVKHWIISGDPFEQFSVSSDSGILFVAKPLDFESAQSYNLSIGLANIHQADQEALDYCRVLVTVKDANDNVPFFPVNPFIIQVTENIPQPLPALIGRPSALDPDTGLNGKLSYSIIQGNTSLFSIDSMNANLLVSSDLDREFHDNYELLVHVSDAGTPRQTATGTVLVQILDRNDNAPEFDQPFYRGSIEENVPTGTIVTRVKATDKDSERNSIIKYSIDNFAEMPFTINSRTGEISSTTELDREKKDEYVILVRASDSGQGKPLSSLTRVIVQVLDSNDNSPILRMDPEIFIPNTITTGDVVFPIDAKDLDAGENAELRFSLSGPDARHFKLNTDLGTVEAATPLKTKEKYTITLTVSDSSRETQKSSSAFIAVLPRSSHDFPVFKGGDAFQSFSVSESQIDTVIATLQARSPKQPPFNRITYSIAGGNSWDAFWIDPITGKLSTNQALDREKKSAYEIWVKASDNSDTPRLASFARIQVTVTDENDNRPAFTQIVYQAEILENKYLPVKVLKVEATDLDDGENSKLSYSIIDGNTLDSFEIGESDGVITTRTSLDREKVSNFELVIQARDNGQRTLSSTALVRISVVDQNDNSPKFTRLFTASVPEDAAIGTQVVQITSSDPDSEEFSNNTYYFSVNPTGVFAIEPFSGNVTVNGILDRESQKIHQLKVVAEDGSWRVETSLTIEVLDVNDNAPMFSQPDAYVFDVLEAQPPLTVVGRVSAIDPDDGVNSELQYSFETKSDLFRVNSLTGEIVSLNSLSYMPGRNTYRLNMIATDNGLPPKRGTIQVTFRVRKPNHEAPDFVHAPTSVAVPETADIGFIVTSIIARDPDQAKEEKPPTYSLEGDRDAQRAFQINETSGSLATTSQMAPVGHTYHVAVKAKDHGFPAKSTEIQLSIGVVGANEHEPKFTSDRYDVNIMDSTESGAIVAQVVAVDNDAGLNGDVHYKLTALQDIPFSLNPESGEVTMLYDGTEELKPEYYLEVTAEDHGNPPKQSRATVVIKVTSTTERKSLNGKLRIFMPENAPQGSTVKTLESHAQGNIYRIIQGRKYFKIENNHIKLISGHGLDYESQRHYNLSWEERNTKQAIVSVTSAELFVTSVNEFRPEFLEKAYSFTIEESLPIGTTIGSVQAVDQDSGPDGKLYYILEESHNNRFFKVDIKTGRIVIDSNLRPSPPIKLHVMVKNRIASPDWVDWCQVEISIVSSRETFMRLESSYEVDILESSPLNTELIKLNPGKSPGSSAFHITGGNVGSSFSISEDTGAIRLEKLLDREVISSYELEVSLSKKNILLAKTTVTIRVLDVNDNGPRILPEGRNGKLMEGDPSGTNIMLFDAYDPDLNSKSSKFRYRLVGQHNSNLFKVDEKSGILTSAAVYDREQTSEYNLLLEVSDSGNPPKRSTTPIKITIEDINDMPSTEDTVSFRYVYHGTAISPGVIGDIHPADADLFGSYSCVFQGQVKSGFSIKHNSCQLGSSVPLQPSEHTFSVRGTDGVHAWVHYEVNLSFDSISSAQLDNLIFVEIAGKETEIQNTFMKSLTRLAVEEELGTPVLSSVRSETKGRHVVAIYFKGDSGQIISGDQALKSTETLVPKLSKETKFDVISVEFDPCSTTPCKNNGECRPETTVDKSGRKEIRSLSHVFSFSPINRTYKCRCGSSFGGSQCELKIDHCGNDPCRNGGTCEEGNNGRPICQCPPEFEGEFCELDRNECSHQSVNGKTGPCSNGGFCENRNGGYTCICLVGFTGTNCEQTIDHCTAKPCENGGKCLMKSEGYECKCPLGFSGRNCQIQSFGFDEDSYVELPSLEPHENLLTMEFATTVSSGLLLYSYSIKEGTNDYVSLDILDGELRLSARLERQGQMNLVLPRRVDDGSWYQVQIEHRIQKLIITLVKCSESGEDCESCQLSDTSCRMTAHLPGIAAIMVPGPSVYLGGVKHYSDLFSRPGQVSAFSFIGCIKGFQLNGKTLTNVGIKSKKNLLDHCPRRSGGPCKGSLEAVCGTGALRCMDRWQKSQCTCSNGFVARHCEEANQPMGFNGGFIHYELSKLFWRRLLFRPVDGSTLVVSDDLLSQQKRNRVKRALHPIATPIPDAKIELDFRTSTREGLLFFAASGEKSFSLIDIINSTIRYSSKLAEGPAVEIRIPENPIVSDGLWHRLTFNVMKDGKQVELGLDGVTKTLTSANPVHVFLGSRLVNMSIGGLHSQTDKTSLVRVKGIPVPALLGCMKRFILNGQAQPPWNDQSEFLTARQVGEIDAGCPGCISPPCSSTPFKSGLGVKEGVIISVIFFVALFILLAVVWLFKRRRDANAKLPASTADHKVASRLSIVAHPGFNPDFVINGERDTLKREGNQSLSDSNSNLLCPLQHTQSRPTLSSRLSGSILEQKSSQSGFVFQFPTNFSAGEGSYTNGLDTTADETLQNSAERYDLDNASSIAPSDIEVSHHYRDFRTVRADDMPNHPNNDIRFASPLSMVSKQMQYRNSPSSVKQLKAALRASPAGLGSSEDFSQKSRSRPGSAHSARRSRRRKGNTGQGETPGSSGSRPRSRSRRSSSRGKGSLRELRKYQSNPTFQDDTSSSSDSEKSYNHRQPSQILTPRILSRSPHAPPKCESSSERSGDDNSIVPSDLDLDKLRKPRRFLGLPDDTETESEAGGPNAVPSSLAPFRPPRTIFPLSEDDSDIPTFLPAPNPPPRSFKNKPLSSISQSSPWFAEDPHKALSENRGSAPTSHEVDLEAYV